MGMGIVEWIEYLSKQQAIVEGALLNNAGATDAFKALMKEADTQINDRDAEIRRLEAKVTELLLSRRAIIERAKSERVMLLPSFENEAPPIDCSEMVATAKKHYGCGGNVD